MNENPTIQPNQQTTTQPVSQPPIPPQTPIVTTSVPTPPPAPKSKAVPILAALLLLALAAAGYFAYAYYQSQSIDNQDLQGSLVVSPTPNPTNQPQSTPNPAGETSQLAEGEPTLEFVEPLDSMDYDDKRNDIHTKVLTPMLEYYANPEVGESLQSLSISLNNEAASSTQFPYSLHAVFDSGAVMDQLLILKDGELDWWIPTCMGPCPYTAEFEQKYPQIVSQTN